MDVSRGEAKAINLACWPMDTTHVGRSVPMFEKVAPPAPPAIMMMAPANARAGVEDIMVTGARAKLAEQSDLGDYKLYTLPEPVTLNPRQTKQVAFLDQKNVAFQRLYIVGVTAWDDYDGDDEPVALEVVLRLENKAANGLGKPLPSGALSAMETADGRPTFAGEQAVRDVPVGEPLDLVIGSAMDVRARPRLVEEKALRGDRVRRTYEIDLSNGKTAPVTFEIRQDPSPALFKVVSEPTRHDIQQGKVAWRITLAPGETRTFRYRIEHAD